jgi:putative transposase
VVGPKAKRRALEAVREKFGLSIRATCRLLGLQQSTFHYESTRKRSDEELIAKMREVVEAKNYYGRPRVIWALRKKHGIKDNHKRIARIYRELGLQLWKRKKSRKLTRPRVLLEVPKKPNELWAMDFVQDAFASGRRFRVLTAKDLFTHEALLLHTDVSITGERVAEALERLKNNRGLPPRIICDNGSEFISKAMDQWSYQNKVDLKFIQPGKPTQNAFIESFNGKFRAECLNYHWFENLEDARKKIEDWRIEYNTDRPCSRFDDLTPIEFATKQAELLYSQPQQ